MHKHMKKNMLKKCNTCQEIKNFSFFRNSRNNCKNCEKDSNRKRSYGISKQEFCDLLKVHNGVCGICEKKPAIGQNLCVDHDHKEEMMTGKIVIRGLLCKNCNLGIGKLGDSLERIEKAIKYLNSDNFLYIPKEIIIKKKNRKYTNIIVSEKNGIITKNCTECNQIKNINDFPNLTAGKLGKKPVCKICDKIAKDSWANMKLYGISQEKYKYLVQKQNGLCAICEKKPNYHRLCIDHDHQLSNNKTSVIRGLLCQDCNMGIGKLGDALGNLNKACEYFLRTYY